MSIYRNGDCRYCERYQTACGRSHSEETRGDWARTWNGYPPPPRIPDGTRVTFTFRGEAMTGEVVDALTFNGKVRHGVRTAPDRVYDVWPDMDIRPEVSGDVHPRVALSVRLINSRFGGDPGKIYGSLVRLPDGREGKVRAVWSTYERGRSRVEVTVGRERVRADLASVTIPANGPTPEERTLWHVYDVISGCERSLMSDLSSGTLEAALTVTAPGVVADAIAEELEARSA